MQRVSYFLVFLRTADAARSQMSSECCAVDVFRLVKLIDDR